MNLSDRHLNRSLERERERDRERERERRMDKQHHNPPSFKDDVLQVFVGNIPHSASEDDIQDMFSRFGRIIRFRVHSNPIKTWLRRYAFLSYENIECVRNCLKKRVSTSIVFNQYNIQRNHSKRNIFFHAIHRTISIGQMMIR